MARLRSVPRSAMSCERCGQEGEDVTLGMCDPCWEIAVDEFIANPDSIRPS